MTFTIFGSTGFIGQALAARLAALGHTVLTPARGEPLPAGRDLGHAIYAIGMTADFRSQPFATVRAHVTVLAEILEHARFESFTYLSSTRVYAGAATGRPDQPLTVNPADPSDLYNLTKLAGEALCLGCGHPGAKVVRLSNVVGKGRPDSANFIDALVREAKTGLIELRSDPQSAKDYIRLDEVVALLPRIAAAGRARIYNLASGRNLTHAVWLEALARLTGCEVRVPTGLPPLVFPVIDIAALKAEFDFTPGAVLDVLPELIA